MHKCNVVDLSGIYWKSAQGEVLISNMDNDRLIRTYAWVVSRQARLEAVKEEIHPIFHKNLFEHNNRSLQEWRELLAAAINARAIGETKSVISKLEKQLDELRPREEKTQAILSELAALKAIV